MADPMVLRRDFRVRLRPVHADLACAAIPSPSATGRHKQQSPAPEAHTRAHASSPGSPSPYTQPPHTSPKTLEREHMRLCCDYAAPSMLRLCCALMGCGPVRSDYSACSAVRRNPSGSDQTLRGFLLTIPKGRAMAARTGAGVCV